MSARLAVFILVATTVVASYMVVLIGSALPIFYSVFLVTLCAILIPGFYAVLLPNERNA